MSFTGALTQEDLSAPKILVVVEKGRKKTIKQKPTNQKKNQPRKNLSYSETKALLQPGNTQQKPGELTLPFKFREVKHRQL